jgi:sigma-B regulation protein RsbU (phosphoserine phosphatase)
VPTSEPSTKTLSTAWEPPSDSTSGDSAPPAALDVTFPEGGQQRFTLNDGHIAIGRSTSLPIVIDHHTVSRRHAEIVRDPFGRYWIRDLASTNGTTVNGETVKERVLSPGDDIGIGDVHATFRRFPAARPKNRSRTMELQAALDPDGPTGASPSWVRSFRDLEPAKVSASHLSALLGFGRKLGEIDNHQERLEALVDLLLGEAFHGLGSVAIRVREGDHDVAILAGPSRSAAERDPDAPYLSRRLLAHDASTGEPALASSISADDRGGMDVTMVGAPFAAIACPIGPRRDGEPLDIIYVSFPILVAGAEWVALVELAADAYRQAEASWVARHAAHAHVAIERELETARRIQRAIIPNRTIFAGLEAALVFEPCRWVGGDYVDTVALPDGRVLLAVADVCGKGLQAALVTFSLHTMVRALADGCGRGMALAELVGRVGAHIGDYLPEDSFATMTCVVADPRTGALEIVNAGHMAPLVVAPDGRARALPAELDPPLGLGAIELSTSHEHLDPGEILFLYTDGLTELRNSSREMLGEQQLTAGLARIVVARPRGTLAELAADLEKLLETYRADQLPEDDRAFVLARRS